MMISRRLSQLGIGFAFLSVALTLDALPARPRADTSGLSPTPAPRPAPVTRSTSTTTNVAPAPSTVSNSSSEGRQSTVVVIDAGHGGFDRGGIPGQRVPEKTMNLDVALRLRSILQANGYRVVMTRDTDVFIPLGTRVAIANSYRNAIFVCIHFNSATRSGASGIETYFYSSQSLGLASAIHYNVAGGAPSANRGVRRRGFYVLRRTTIPSVLVECGFLTNPNEAQYAQNSAYQQKLAEEIAAGVRSRGSVSGSSRVATAASVPLQPFIDQTRVHDPDLSRSKHSRKSARHKSSSTKKKSTKKSSDSSDSESTTTKKKKKSSSTKTED